MDLVNVFKYGIAVLFKAIPRNKHIWITGKKTGWGYQNTPPQFFDNSKYFFLYLVNETDEKVFWLSNSMDEYNLLKAEGLPVIKPNSIKWIILTLRAKYAFQHYGTEQIDRIFEYGSVQIDFWHGTPLKKIKYDVVPKPDFKPNLVASFLMRSGCEYISSTSEYLSKAVLQHAFAAEKWQMMNFGYPRMDILKYDKNTIKEFCAKYSKNLLSYIHEAEGKKVFLYMPTFRDDDREYFKKASIDYEKLDNELENNNAVIFIKLHPLTEDVNICQYKNIYQIANDIDIYPFLKFVDFLITDYSSIFFDYLVLDREIIFIPYDYDNYVKNRELYFDYDEVTPGVKYKNFDEFIKSISMTDELDYSKERKRVKELFIGEYNYDACERTYNFIKGMEGKLIR